MKRTDADGNVLNLFSDGNPGVGQLATVVDASILNAFQEEICNVIELSGGTLDENDYAQMYTAIVAIAGAGAVAPGTKLTLANGQAVAANLAGLVFNKASYYGARIGYHLSRFTDTGGSEKCSMGVLTAIYSPKADSWDVVEEVAAGHDAVDHGVVFSITSAGQIQYTSSISGAPTT